MTHGKNIFIRGPESIDLCRTDSNDQGQRRNTMLLLPPDLPHGLTPRARPKLRTRLEEKTGKVHRYPERGKCLQKPFMGRSQRLAQVEQSSADWLSGSELKPRLWFKLRSSHNFSHGLIGRWVSGTVSGCGGHDAVVDIPEIKGGLLGRTRVSDTKVYGR